MWERLDPERRAMGDLKGITIPIKLEIDPVVILECRNTACRHNLYLEGCLCCNLKRLAIDLGGECASKEERHESVKA